jgi:ubiquinone/menaquinone biosynthesis C-methylase UbiE
VTRHRDIAAFNDRAPGYDQGWQGRLHHEIADRTVALLASSGGAPAGVLDVGCGTGYLLQQLARRWPATNRFVGVDPAPSMIDLATARADDGRLAFCAGVAERLPCPDGAFDLVVSTTSFDHWADQPAGLAECARVLAPGGRLVLVDQFSLWLLPTLVAGRRHKARTRRRAERLLRAAGFRSPAWHGVYAVIINAVTATT